MKNYRAIIEPYTGLNYALVGIRGPGNGPLEVLKSTNQLKNPYLFISEVRIPYANNIQLEGPWSHLVGPAEKPRGGGMEETDRTKHSWYVVVP